MSRCRRSGPQRPARAGLRTRASATRPPKPAVRRARRRHAPRCTPRAGARLPAGQDGTRQGLISSRLRIRRGTSPGALPAHACRARLYQSRRGSGAHGKRSERSPKGGVQASLWRSGSRTRRMIRTSLPPGGAPKSPTRSARKGAGCSKPGVFIERSAKQIIRLCRNHLIPHYDALGGFGIYSSAPAARASPFCDSAVLPAPKSEEFFCTGNPLASHCAPSPLGDWWRKRGPLFQKRFPTELGIRNTIFFLFLVLIAPEHAGVTNVFEAVLVDHDRDEIRVDLQG